MLQFFFKANAGYLLMLRYLPTIRSLSVRFKSRLPDEFYITKFKVAVALDASHKYAVGYF